MRLWLKDSERRPDPQTLRPDDRKAVSVGLVAWVVALGVLLVYSVPLNDAGNGWWLVTCAVGIALGLLGLIYLSRPR